MTGRLTLPLHARLRVQCVTGPRRGGDCDKVATCFGPLTMHLDSALDQGRIRATVECPGDRKPTFVELRVPHPQGRKATRVEGGRYNPETERVRVEPFSGKAEITLRFE